MILMEYSNSLCLAYTQLNSVQSTMKACTAVFKHD